jgi:hypothetical protein
MAVACAADSTTAAFCTLDLCPTSTNALYRPLDIVDDRRVHPLCAIDTSSVHRHRTNRGAAPLAPQARNTVLLARNAQPRECNPSNGSHQRPLNSPSKRQLVLSSNPCGPRPCEEDTQSILLTHR